MINVKTGNFREELYLFLFRIYLKENLYGFFFYMLIYKSFLEFENRIAETFNPTFFRDVNRLNDSQLIHNQQQ